MAKRKFGSYSIDYKKISKSKDRLTGNIVAKVQLSGNIEIGIDIDQHTWRGDWLSEKIFGVDSSNYSLVAVSNQYQSYSPVEVNLVTAIFKERRY